MKEITLQCGTHVTMEILDKAHTPGVARITIDDRAEVGTLYRLENGTDLKKVVILVEKASLPEIIELLLEVHNEMDNAKNQRA